MLRLVSRLSYRALSLGALALGVAACGNATPEPPPEQLSDPGPQDASFDGALSFDGVDDYASVGTARMPLLESDQTLMLWFLPKAPVAAADELQVMFALRRSGWSGVALAVRSGVPLVRNVYSERDLAIAEAAVTLDAWHHAAVVIEPDRTELFIDGVSVSKAAQPGQNRTPIEAYLGSADGHGQAFHGLLDEVRVYPRTYSPEQIAEAARGVRADEADAPVLYLSFNEAAGARCYDRSGLDNHAELGDGVASLMPLREKSGVPNVPPSLPAP
jgi:hypothetical protein